MDAPIFETQLAAVAAAIGDPARTRMLCALMNGRAYTATELSVVAEVSPSTASSHLARLQAQRLILCVPQGRHRYFRLANPQVAAVLEQLMGLSQNASPAPPSRTPSHLRQLRTCYDHMAGEIAVALHDQLCAQGWLDAHDYALSDAGRLGLQQLGVDLTPLPGRRPFACACLDWSERRPHIGGQLGAMLLAAFVRHAWVQRQLDSRALQLTAAGQRLLQRHFAWPASSA